MASSRASSPAVASQPASPVELTPNSKVKAMLAAMDNDSEDVDMPIRRLSSFNKNSSRTPTVDSSARSLAASDGIMDDDEEEDDDEEDMEIVRPRGRAAARMQVIDDARSSDGGENGTNPRDRIRKLLFTKKAKSIANPATEASTLPTEYSSGDDMPIIASRRRKTNNDLQTTPSGSRESSAPASPGMFVSPAASARFAAVENSGSEDDLPSEPQSNARFLKLVAKKRKERQALEAEKAKAAVTRAEDLAKHARLMKLDKQADLDGSDDEDGRRLTQQSRPARKAGKKALEEMHRETQRMARNMQLAHQAKTKKKITKASFFARFNYFPPGFEKEDEAAEPTTSSSPVHSDALQSTPPTSPPSIVSDSHAVKPALDAQAQFDIDTIDAQMLMLDDDLPALEETITRHIPSSPPVPSTSVNKGKGKATTEATPIIGPTSSKPSLFRHRPTKIHTPQVTNVLDDSDDDLEITQNVFPALKTKTDAIFDRVPAKQAGQSHSLYALRMLAQLTSPGKQRPKKNVKPSMTNSEMQLSLQQRARQQAKHEREERLQALRERGIIPQTAEERQREQAEVEDLVAKARREGEELMRQEKEASKNERKANGEVDPLGDSSDDEDWEANNVEDADDISLSGSDAEHADIEGDEEDDDMEEEDEDAESVVGEGNGVLTDLIDNEASETESDAEKVDVPEEHLVDPFIDDEEEDLPVVQSRRRTTHVISDDEDEDGDESNLMDTPAAPRTISPRTAHSDSPIAPNSVLRSATKTFIPGITVAGAAGLGLTQIFQGTMDDSQPQDMFESPKFTRPDTQQLDPDQDSMAFLRNLPAPVLPTFKPTMDDTSQEMIMESQGEINRIPASQPNEDVSQGIQLDFTQSQINGFESMIELGSQMSELPEATQDVGFQDMTPIRGRFVNAPPSTVETVLLGTAVLPELLAETPVVKKKGRLQKRIAIPDFSDDDVEVDVAAADEFEITADAFDVMRKASKKITAIDDFDKKKSAAKDMVHEQAEESEDEYAGLGGNSDDESGGEEDAFVKGMIDDEGGKDVDERQLAAFFADRERQQDEKAVEKLFKDITNGNLRRKRGANYDLDDSDDDGEARRRMKQREFAKMRKALLADERIEKMAENPKSMAFLRALEDRGDDDEMDFLDEVVESQEPSAESQSQAQAEGESQDVEVVPNSQVDATMGPPKRKLPLDTTSANRLPPHLRRTQASKKPSNLSEIRQSLSSLIEEPNAIHETRDDSSDSDLEIEDDPEDLGNGSNTSARENEKASQFAARRTTTIVDRISLKRQSSSSVSASTRLAFATTSASAIGFKVPPLLRRATTNSSITSTTGSSVSSNERSAGTGGVSGGFGNNETVTKKAGRNSGIHHLARETERREKVKLSEKRREEKKFRGVEGRRKMVGGLFGKGSFE